MSHINCHKTALIVLAVLAIVVFAPISSAALMPYSQDFEAMTPGQGWPDNDLSDDGWEIYGFAWDANPDTGPANQVYFYGPYPAANGAPGSIQGVAEGEGGPNQGSKALVKYSDYNNLDQPIYYIQALTYREGGTITSSDLGLWRFAYDAKIGNLEDDSSAFAYIRVLEPGTFLQKAFVKNDSTDLPITWDRYDLYIYIDETMVGDMLSFGFSATSTDYNGSAVFYDNLSFARVVIVAEIDVKPGSFPNSINVGSRGKIPVAILTTAHFDASTVDVSTIQFGPGDAQPVHYALEDVDGDTDWDLILHFNTQEVGIVCGDIEVTITGQTLDAVPVLGTDSIKTVGCE